MTATVLLSMLMLAKPPPSLQDQEDRVAACAGLEPKQRALAGTLREHLEKLAVARARLEAERIALERAREDLLWLADSIEQTRQEATHSSASANANAGASSGAGTTETDDKRARSQRLKLIKIVGKMRPAAASQLLLALDPALAKQVVAGLRPAQAAKVLASMEPGRAAPIAAAIARAQNRGAM